MKPAKSFVELLSPGRALTFANVVDGAEGLIVCDLTRAIAAKPNKPAISLAVVCRDGPRMQRMTVDLGKSEQSPDWIRRRHLHDEQEGVVRR